MYITNRIYKLQYIFIFTVSPSPPDDPLSTDSSELSTNGDKSAATNSLSTNKTKKPKEKKEDPEVIRKWKEQQVRFEIFNCKIIFVSKYCYKN